MASAFKIESGVPLPGLRSGGYEAKYPWSEMRIGDSFFTPLSAYSCRSGSPTIEKYLTNMRRVCAGRREGKFRVRLAEGGLRIWRIA